MSLKDLIQFYKDNQAGKKLHAMQKDIELLTLQELLQEISYISSKYKKAEALDERVRDLFKELYSYGPRHKNSRVANEYISNVLYFESENVKKELFELQAGMYPLDFLERQLMNRMFIRFAPTRKVIWERRANVIKSDINNFTNRITKPFRKLKEEPENQEQIGFYGNIVRYSPNPFELKKSNKEEEAFNQRNIETTAFIRAQIFANHFEYIDLDSFFHSLDVASLFNIYEALPEDEKAKFANLYFYSKDFNYLFDKDKIKVFDKLKSYISHENLVRAYMRDESNEFYSDIQITDADALMIYKELYGYVPDKIRDRLEEALNNFSFEEMIDFIEDIENQDKFNFSFLVNHIENERINELLNNEKISPKLKESILSKYIIKLSPEERQSLFSSFDADKQLKFFNSFTFTYLYKDTDKEKYYEGLRDTFKDEDAKELFNILFLNKKCSVEEFARIVNNRGKYFSIGKSNLLKFSDDELKQLYELLDDENIKDDILGLNRKLSYFDLEFNQNTTKLTKAEIEEYNKNIPESILLNNDTIWYYLETAKSCKVYGTILYKIENNENLDFSKLLEEYKRFIGKKGSLLEDRYINLENIDSKFKAMIATKATLQDYLKLIDEGLFNKNELFENNRISSYIDVKIEDAAKELFAIEEIQDIQIKSYLLNKLNESLIYTVNRKSLTISKDNSNIKTLQNIYKDKILDKSLSISNRYLYLSMYLYNAKEKIVDSDKKLEVEPDIEDAKQLFHMLNEETGRLDYDKIFDLTPKYEMSDFFGEEICSTPYYNIVQCMPYLDSDNVYFLMQKLYNSNNKISKLISPEFFKDELINTLDYDIIEYLSRFGYDITSRSYANNKLSEEKIILFSKAYSRLKDIKSYPEECSMELMALINSLNSTEINNFDFENSNNLDLLLFFTLHKDAKDSFLGIKVENEQNRFQVYKEYIKEKAREDIHSPLLNRRKALDALGKRFFNYSYIEMKELRDKYTTDFDVVYKKYVDKAKAGTLSLEEENELKALKILRNISELLEIKDTEALVKVFDELDKDEEYQECDFGALSVLDDNLKRVYARDMNEHIYIPREEEKVDNVDGIEVYSPREFNMFVHVVAAFGDYSLLDKEHPGNSAKDKWNDTTGKENHILCTSYITNGNMCYARTANKDDERVIFGFSHINNNAIVMASADDIGSDTTNFNSDSSYYLSDFRTASNIASKCRHGHNEVDVERRIENKKETNIQPDYIVCFNEINESSKKVAKDFGIPIVLINKRTIAEQESKKLNDLIQQFKDKKEPELLDKIVNSFFCARTCYLIGDEDKKLNDEFFNPEYMEEQMKEIMEIIEKERRIGNKQKADECYIALYEALNAEIELDKEEYLDPETVLCDGKFHIRQFRHNVKKIIENQSIQKSKISSDNSAIQEKNENNMYQIIRREIKHDREVNR